jgi:hypothetical protein
MVHKSSIIPGLSKFIDENVLAQYSPTSMKRILMAGAVSLYLQQGEGLVDELTSSPLISGLGVTQNNGMINIDPIRDVLKREIQKVGFMRLTVPMVGDIDFTTEDIDALYNDIVQANTQAVKPVAPSTPPQYTINNGGVY